MKNKVSILIRSYNHQDTIWKSLRSAVLQTYENCEVILIDGGSHDKTTKICDVAKNRYPQLKIINTSEKKLIPSQFCSGEYVLIMNGDEELDFNAVYRMMNATYKNEADLCFAGFVECGEVFKKRKDLPKTKKISKKEMMKWLLKLDEEFSGLSGKLIRRKSLNDIEISCVKSYQDILVLNQILNKCEEIVALSNIIVYYKNRNDSELNPSTYEDYIFVHECQNSLILESYPELQKVSRRNLRRCYTRVVLSGYTYGCSTNVSTYSMSSLLKSLKPFYKVHLE